MKNILTLFFAAVLLGSCGKSDSKVVADNRAPISVTVAKVAAENNNSFLSASGKVIASKSAELSTRFMGYVTSTPVKVGDKVRKGQLLLSINSSDLQAKKAQVNASIMQAKAGFVNAEKDYNRFKNLLSQNSISQKEMDDITAHYNMAKAQLEAAKQMKNEVNAQLNYTNITAPFSGTIVNRFIEKGNMANPGMPLITIENNSQLEVMAMVPETEIASIKKGATVNVVIKAIAATLIGKVVEVSTSAKNTGGQFLVKVALDKSDKKILSGMFATVQFPVEQKTNTMVLIPETAIVKQGQLQGLYTVSESNTALLRWLRLGKTYGDKVEVLSGLAVDERYITSAEEKLYNGAKLVVK